MDVGHDRRRSLASHQPARLKGGHWPARAQRLLEATYTLCVEGLHAPMRQCLDEFEKQLFALAERAHRHAEQQDFFVSRQRVLQDRATFEQRFAGHLASALNQIDRDASAPSKPAADSPWAPLELLDPVEQELSLALEQLGTRGDARHSGVLYELGYRLAVLVGMPPLDGETVPVGPHALAQAFHRACAELELPLDHQLLLLHVFDQSVIQTLTPLYDALNQLLLADGVLPQLRSVPVTRHIARVRASAEPAAAPAPAPTEPGRATAGSGGQGGSIEVLESLRDLLAQRRAGQGSGNGEQAERAASAEELQTALGALQQHLAQVTDHASRELRSAGRLREELLNQLNIGQPSGAPRTQLTSEQGDTVELVAMLFEQLGQQLQQGGSARSLLGDLQVPMLRMAVADRGFFDKREHPARQLLDTVAAAANDWLDGSDDESNRPLATKLEQLVARAGQEPPSTDLYASLLSDIEHHLGLLSRKAQAAERRHVEAAQGRERLDQARQRAGKLMAERFAQSPPRGLLRTLLDRAWSDVLALTLLRHGEDSEAFEAQLAVTDQLLGRLPVNDRLQLQQDVEIGLQQIGMHAEESVQVAQRLLGSEKADPTQDLPSATDLAMRLKQHQRLGEAASQHEPAVTRPKPAPTQTRAPSPRDMRIEQHLRELPFGSWFEFIDPATGQIARRKLAWYSPMSGRCLLVSRRGQRGEEMSLSQLAHEIASGRVCEVPAQREGLLDRAWRGLTGSLRQSPHRSNLQEPDRR